MSQYEPPQPPDPWQEFEQQQPQWNEQAPTISEPQWQQPPSQPFPPQQQPPQWQEQPMQQSQWQQQPPPMQPYASQYQPPMSPPKKSRKGLFIVLGVILAIVLIACVGISVLVAGGIFAARQAVNQVSTQVVQQTTQVSQPTQPTTSGTWTTVQTFTGNGTRKTAVFTVPDNWKIVYTCTYLSINGITANGVLVVSVFGADGTPLDAAAVNATCKKGVTKTTGETEEHQGGQVYLNITGTGDWTIQIQELK